MDLPFTGFELTFIIIAFFIFSLFSLASICIQSEEAPAAKDIYEARKSRPSNKKQRVIIKQAGQKP